MPTIADMEANMRAAQDRLAQYSQTSPSSVRQEINAAWSPILDKAAGEVSNMKQEFLPRYFEGMMNTGYGMGTSEADLSPTQKLSQMGNMLGQFGGDLARGQSVVDYLGGSLKDQYAQALDALKWKTTLAQQEYDNWWQQYQFEKQLQDAAAARAAANAQNGSLLSQLDMLLNRTGSQIPSGAGEGTVVGGRAGHGATGGRLARNAVNNLVSNIRNALPF